MVCQLIVQDEKNMMKSDFKKSLPIDEKNQIRNGQDYVGSCVGGCIFIVCGDFLWVIRFNSSKGQISF